MVLVEMLMVIALPNMGELLVMMMMVMVSPSGREVPPAESLRRRAKVLLPKFRLETAALRPECPPLYDVGWNPRWPIFHERSGFQRGTRRT